MSITLDLFADCPVIMPLALAAKKTGISRTELRRMIADQRLSAIKVGRAWRLRKDALAALIDSLPAVAD